MTDAPPPRITRIEPLRRRGGSPGAGRVRLHLEDEEPLEVALEAVERSGLGVGDPLPHPARHHLLNADADVRVRDAALNLLSWRARTRRELRRKLIGKEFRPARVDACLDRLAERGLLDDRAVAAAFVRDRLRHRPRGPVRLRQELRAKGVEGGTAAEVVDEVLAEERISASDLALRVVDGWVARQGPATLDALVAPRRSLESERARRRLLGYLGRRGFAGSALASAMDLARIRARLARGSDEEP